MPEKLRLTDKQLQTYAETTEDLLGMASELLAARAELKEYSGLVDKHVTTIIELRARIAELEKEIGEYHRSAIKGGSLVLADGKPTPLRDVLAELTALRKRCSSLLVENTDLKSRVPGDDCWVLRAAKPNELPNATVVPADGPTVVVRIISRPAEKPKPLSGEELLKKATELHVYAAYWQNTSPVGRWQWAAPGIPWSGEFDTLADALRAAIAAVEKELLSGAGV